MALRKPVVVVLGRVQQLQAADTLDPASLPDTLVYTSDARLSDARTPTAHHATHETGGADALAALDASVIVTGTLPAARGGTGTGTAFTAGSVVFAGASGVYAQNNANLFWDDAAGTLKVLNGTASDQLRLGTAANYYKFGRSATTGALDVTGTQAGFTGLTVNGPLVLGGTAINSGFYLDITQSVASTAGFRITNATAGAAAQIQNQLKNDLGAIAYYGITSSTYSGFAPINSGRAFWMSNACDAVFGSQGANAIHVTQNGADVATVSTAGVWNITAAADSTSTSTGGMTLAGGLGVAKSVTVGGWYRGGSGTVRLTANVTNATVTFSNLADLSVTLVAGRKYTGTLSLRCSDSVAADGIKFDFNGGTATMTTFNAGVTGNVQGATAGVTVSAALATAINFTAMNGTTDHWITFAVSLVCNAGGTFVPRFAQNAHSTGTATAALGGFLQLEDSTN
jgi:hypothetical protein